MRKKKRGLLLVGLCMLLLGGCGSSQKDRMQSIQMEENAYDTDDIYTENYGEEYTPEEGDPTSGTTDTAQADVSTNRKLIKNVSLNVETTDFDSLVYNVEKRVGMCSGYIESSEVRGSSQSESMVSRTANYTIRIPSDRIDEFVTAISDMSNVIDRNQSVEDVTLAYVDRESKKKTLQIEQERLLALLEQATSIEVIIELESRLTDIRYQIESMESQLRTYDNLVEYATITVGVEEVMVLTPVVKDSVGERISNGFKMNIQKVGSGFVNLFVWVVTSSPYLVLWAAILLVILFVGKRIHAKCSKKI